jgi:hypothetical protein
MSKIIKFFKNYPPFAAIAIAVILGLIGPSIAFFFKMYAFEIIFNFLTLIFVSMATINVKLFQLYFKFEKLFLAYHLIVTALFVGNNLLLVILSNIPTLQELTDNGKYLFLIGLMFYYGVLAAFVYKVDESTGGSNYWSWKNLSEGDVGRMVSRERNITVQWETIKTVYYSRLALLFQIVMMIIYLPTSLNPSIKRFKQLGFSIDPLFYFIVNILIMVVNYNLISTWRWIKFSRTYDSTQLMQHLILQIMSLVQTHPISSITVSFFCSAFQASKLRFSNETCMICMDTNPTCHFCQYHCFHEDCLVGHLSSKTEDILKQVKWNRPTYHQAYENSVRKPESDYYTQTLDIKKESLPSCPICRQHMTQNKVEINIERQRFRYSADIKLIE